MEQEKNQGRKRLTVESTLLLTALFGSLAVVIDHFIGIDKMV